MKNNTLKNIAYYVEERISSSKISLGEFVTTDSLLQNKKGRTKAQNLPPQPCSLTRFQKGDVLVANIRPYLKKIWQADIDGGCSPDVLVFRSINPDENAYLYSLLLQDSFFDFVMKAPKGSKMPRGDKNHIMTFPCYNISCKKEIGLFTKKIDEKIQLNEQINRNLAA